MSFLKFLAESGPIDARSANFIPFPDEDSIVNGRWMPPSDDSHEEDQITQTSPTNKKREILDALDRLRQLIDDGEEDEEPMDDFADETSGESTPMDDDLAGNLDDFEDEVDPEDDSGVRRYVKNAHLVFKKRMPDGLYEELWIYNVGRDSRNDEYQIRREILGATDIEPPETSSKDGSQSYSTWTAGNAQMLHIVGLPN